MRLSKSSITSSIARWTSRRTAVLMRVITCSRVNVSVATTFSTLASAESMSNWIGTIALVSGDGWTIPAIGPSTFGDSWPISMFTVGVGAFRIGAVGLGEATISIGAAR